MDHLIEMGYVGLEVNDPAAFDAFFTDVIGLEKGPATTDGMAAYRLDDRRHRILVAEGHSDDEADDAAFIGIEAVDAAAFEKVSESLEASGRTVAQGTDDEIAARAVDDLRWTMSPWGVRVELVQGLERGGPFESDMVPDGFVTDGVGFGHVVFATTAYDDSLGFVTDGLGMVQSDWMEDEIAPGIQLTANFFHCNPRHHSLAIGRAPFELPQALHHIMIEATSIDAVGTAFDRVWDSETPIAQGIGRHDNDRMISFYVITPGGFQFEFGYGARTIGDGWDENRMYTGPSIWGHRPVARPS